MYIYTYTHIYTHLYVYTQLSIIWGDVEEELEGAEGVHVKISYMCVYIYICIYIYIYTYV